MDVVHLKFFCEAPKNFEATLIRALTTRGDVDTFAAVLSNLWGVYPGPTGLPDYWMICVSGPLLNDWL